VNLAKVRDRIQEEVTSLSPFRLAKLAAHIYHHFDPQPNRVGETLKLEARIAEDFDDLPEGIAEEFWADALNPRLEDSRLEP
jgi:hypothetical protein